MTKVNIEINNKTYSFEGENIQEALSSVKYSRIPLKIVRTMGFSWAKKILWPTFKNLNKRKWTTVDVKLPSTLKSILNSKTNGNINAGISMNLCEEKFTAEASGRFKSSDLNLDFSSSIDRAEKVGNALKESLNLFSNYNIYVKKLTFKVSQYDDADKKANIHLDAVVPDNISQNIGR
jgi:hypothetical protein